ncbi:MAG TPA: hypothetical protein VHU18_13910 [Rhizomicrobium sp.]|jgi:hypothetical protein|nr:hypothetical protein [Rhizomicrobium sp.]
MRVDAIVLAALMASAASSLSSAHAAAPGLSFWAPPITARGSCSFRQTEIASSASFDQSDSTSFVNLKDAGSITFTQSQRGCVAGAFFANAGAEGSPDGGHVLLQVVLDGTPCAPLTGGYIFANTGSDTSSHSAALFCGGKIAPGKHTIQVQYASGPGANSVFYQRTLEVSHE